MDQTAPHTPGIRPAGLMGSGIAAPVRRVAVNNSAPRQEVRPAPLPTVEIIRGDKRAQEVVTQE
jgi:3-hydroxyacyl-CoA dehydrogenase